MQVKHGTTGGTVLYPCSKRGVAVQGEGPYRCAVSPRFLSSFKVDEGRFRLPSEGVQFRMG